jgi:hypothetical protein
MPKKNKKYLGMAWLDHGCFPDCTMFAFGMGYDEIITMLKRKKDEAYIEGLKDSKELIDGGHFFALARTLKNKEGEVRNLYYLIIKEFQFDDLHYCILVHECLHITNFFLQRVLNRDTEFEAEAYFHTHLMEQCLKFLRGNK